MGEETNEGVRSTYPEGQSPFSPTSERSRLQRISPIASVLPTYDRPTFTKDLLAGLTVAALAIPAGLAYGELAGLTPVAGLYALLLPTIIYTLLGSSRQLIIGPEGSISALVAASILPLAAGDATRTAELAAMLAAMVGVIYALARLARLGWVADYLSRPVLIGYVHGVAAVLVVSQLGSMLGLEVAADDPVGQLVEVLRELNEAHAATVVVSGLSLALIGLLRWRAPKVPGPLVVVVLAIALSIWTDLADDKVVVVGSIPAGLPGLAFPAPDLEAVVDLLPAAVGIFVVGFADAILTARSFAGAHGQHIRADQELLALGVSNTAAAVTGAFPVGASGSRTAVNDQAGGRTQIAGLVAAVAVAVVLLMLTGPMASLPKATLGAVIVAAAIGLVDVHAWRELDRASHVETVIALTTAVGVVTFGVLRALIVAVALSLVDVVRRSARPHDAVLGWVERVGRFADVSLHPSARVTPGVLVYRLDDRLFFANAGYVRGRVREAMAGAPSPVRWLVFDAEGLSHIDATGAEALTTLVDSLRREDIAFAVARLKGSMLDDFRDVGLVESIGAARFFPTVRDAVDAGQALIGTKG